MPKWFEAFARRNLRDEKTHETLRAFEMAIGGRSPKTLPILERRGLQIFDAIASDDRQSIFLASLEKHRLARVPFRRSVIQ